MLYLLVQPLNRFIAIFSLSRYIYSAIIFQHHGDRGFFSSFGQDEA